MRAPAPHMLPMSTPRLAWPPTVKLSGAATHAVNLPLAGCSEWRVASTSFTHLAEDARRRSPAGEGWFTGTMEEGRAQPPLAPPRRVGKGYLSEPSLLILVIRCAPEVFCHAEFSCSATLIYIVPSIGKEAMVFNASAAQRRMKVREKGYMCRGGPWARARARRACARAPSIYIHILGSDEGRKAGKHGVSVSTLYI